MCAAKATLLLGYNSIVCVLNNILVNLFSLMCAITGIIFTVYEVIIIQIFTFTDPQVAIRGGG